MSNKEAIREATMLGMKLAADVCDSSKMLADGDEKSVAACEWCRYAITQAALALTEQWKEEDG